jgi:ubiquinol-cytochrome c reductase cytochrome b subunit
MLGIFVVSFVVLAVCGLKPPAGIYPVLGRICTITYFSFFVLMPLYTKFEPVKPVPERVTGHA